MTNMAPTGAAVDAERYMDTLQRAVRLDESERGRVRMAGRDRAALLQRLTTNDVARLQPGDGARTVLINHNARILDLLTVYALPEHLLVTTNPGSGSALARFLSGKIFYNDKVTVEDLTGGTLQLQLYGPQAAAAIEAATGIDPRAWPLHHIQAASIGAAQAWVARTLPLGGDGFVVVGQRADASAIEQAFAAIPALDAATRDVLRIEQGYGAAGHEHSQEYIPLESGLLDAISFSKGCYVGQEIIARMESRNRLAKRLMGLRLAQPAEPGQALMFEGKAAGDLTSTAVSPRFGPIGLAYVRTSCASAGTHVTVGGVDAEVVELPFGAEPA